MEFVLSRQSQILIRTFITESKSGLDLEKQISRKCKPLSKNS